MKLYILLTSVAILVTGCTSTSNLKHRAGSDGAVFKNNPEVTLKDFKLNKNKNKDESTADNNPPNQDTPVDTPVDTPPTDTQQDNTQDNPQDDGGYDPLTDGLYGPYT